MLFWKKKAKKRSHPELVAAVKRAKADSVPPDITYDEVTDVIDIALAQTQKQITACQQKASDTLREMREIRLPHEGPTEKLGG